LFLKIFQTCCIKGWGCKFEGDCVSESKLHHVELLEMLMAQQTAFKACAVTLFSLICNFLGHMLFDSASSLHVCSSLSEMVGMSGASA
jgi:hypothetical protein